MGPNNARCVVWVLCMFLLDKFCTSSNGSSNGSRSSSSNGSTSSGGTSSNGTSSSTSRSSNGSTSSGTTTNKGSRRVLSPQVCIWRVRMGGDDKKGTRRVRDGENGPKRRQTHRLGPRYVFFFIIIFVFVFFGTN